jgi:hypothetical protein
VDPVPGNAALVNLNQASRKSGSRTSPLISPNPVSGLRHQELKGAGLLPVGRPLVQNQELGCTFVTGVKAAARVLCSLVSYSVGEKPKRIRSREGLRALTPFVERAWGLWMLRGGLEKMRPPE